MVSSATDRGRAKVDNRRSADVLSAAGGTAISRDRARAKTTAFGSNIVGAGAVGRTEPGADRSFNSRLAAPDRKRVAPAQPLRPDAR